MLLLPLKGIDIAKKELANKQSREGACQQIEPRRGLRTNRAGKQVLKPASFLSVLLSFSL